MNDFSELEKELRKLRPAQPSPVLFERVGEALKDSGAGITEWRSLVRRWGGEAAHPWWSLGFGLARAAVLILFAAGFLGQPHRAPPNRAAKAPVPPNRNASPRGRT